MNNPGMMGGMDNPFMGGGGFNPFMGANPFMGPRPNSSPMTSNPTSTPNPFMGGGEVTSKDIDDMVKEIEKKYGIKRQKELMNIVSDICTDILCKNDDITIDKIVKKSSKELILRLKGSSGRIHIMSNSHLMDINQERKEEGNRAFPFVKQMDKFTTLYVFITKDKSEPFRINTDDNINILLNCIVESLQVNIPETNPKYIPVEYNGYINLMED